MILTCCRLNISNGMVAGIDLPETARMYPHQFKGEGQFVAHFNLKAKIQHLNVRQVRVISAENKLPCGRNLPKKHLKINLRGILQTFWRSALSPARTLARFRETQDCS